jgi:DNA-binding NtrC family response regulator
VTLSTVDTASDPRLVGISAVSRAIRDDIDSAARADAKVLITGETGAGKDVIARLIHRRGARRLAPFATINCAGVPDALIESELFGHLRGSFTDAYRDKAGILESAANGTVFLDEVGEMSSRMQAALLRFLESGEIQRVGSDRVHARVNVRIVAATNRDLHAQIAAGRFREDLYYRLNVIHIHVPPLRERREDIPSLLEHFLELASRQHGAPQRVLAPEVVDLLSAHEWPGNVRQLRNAVERLVLKSPGARIELRDVPADLGNAPGAGPSAVPATAASTARAARGVDAHLQRMLDTGESWWSAVYTPFMSRDLSRSQVKAILAEGLERASGNYRVVLRLFNMPESDYKRFLSFLRKHECQLPHMSFRRNVAPMRSSTCQEAAWPAFQPAVGM